MGYAIDAQEHYTGATSLDGMHDISAGQKA
jgi:hypothetical protein